MAEIEMSTRRNEVGFVSSFKFTSQRLGTLNLAVNQGAKEGIFGNE